MSNELGWSENPQELLSDVLSVLEYKVEWPLTEVMDLQQVQRLLAPLRQAINSELKDLE
jgi:hypothetical protein